MTLSNNTGADVDQRAIPAEFHLGFAGRALAAGGKLWQQYRAAVATNALTLIDLSQQLEARQTFTLGNPPLAVAFGLDDNALVVTTSEFIMFDPTVGTTTTLQTIAQVAPTPSLSRRRRFPIQFSQASPAVSRDGSTIAGIGGTSPYFLYRYNVATKVITARLLRSSPPAGPRVVSLSDDGSLATFVWWVADANFDHHRAIWQSVGSANVGSTLIDSSRNLIYAQIPPDRHAATANTNPPILMIVDSDNLTVKNGFSCLKILPERACSPAITTPCMRSPIAASPCCRSAVWRDIRVCTASIEDLLFLGNFCNRGAADADLTHQPIPAAIIRLSRSPPTLPASPFLPRAASRRPRSRSR